MKRSKYVVFVLCVLGASATDGLHQRTVDAAASAPPAVNIRHVNTMNFNVVVGDFNGDGIVDLVGSEPWVNEPPFLTIALGKGDGTFAPATRIGWVARALAAADFDGDGKLDLLVKGLPENDSPVFVIAGRGDGTFATPPAPSTVAQPSYVYFARAADVDGDGKQDVVLGVDVGGTNQILVVPGNGDLTFRYTQATTIPAQYPLGGDVRDVNGDGRADIVVADYDARALIVMLNQGAFNFATTNIALDRHPTDVALANLDPIGGIDIVASAANDAADGLYFTDGAVYVFLGGGDGTFGAPTVIPTDRGAYRVLVADLNRDGIPDVATANRAAKRAEDFCGFQWDTVTILKGTGGGDLLADTSSYSLGNQANLTDTRFRDSVLSIAAADFNGDGWKDIVTSWGAVLLTHANDPNWAPTVTARATAPDANDSITLTAPAADVDQDALSYSWTDSAGQWIEPTPAPCVYTPTTGGTHTFTVTVDDRHGHTAASSVSVDFGTISGGGTTPGSVTVTAPAAGGTIQAGTPYTVQWTASGDLSSVSRWILQVSTGGSQFTDIAECSNVAASARSCTWNSPGPPTSTAQIIVTNGSTTTKVSGISGVFSIAGANGGVIGDGWAHSDVGAVGAPGSATFDGYVWDGEGLTVNGSGADIWGTADEFHYAWKQMNGDFSIDTMVESVQNVNAWTKAGLMVRLNATDPRSPHASIFVSPSKGIAFQRRAAEGGTTVSNQGPLLTAPVWLRLVRVGDILTAYYRKQLTDTWISLGQQGLTGYGSIVSVGLAVTSHADGTVAKGVFKGVYLASQPLLFTNKFGNATGSASTDGTIYTVNASGSDIWGTSDSFVFLSAVLGANEQITARVRIIGNTDAWAKAGVMIRETLTAGSKHADAIVSPGKGVAMQYRSVTDGTSASAVQINGAAPIWLRIRRSEPATGTGSSTFTTWYSTDRQIWRVLGSVSITMTRDAFVGLAVTSHKAGVETQAAFDDIRIQP